MAGRSCRPGGAVITGVRPEARRASHQGSFRTITIDHRRNVRGLDNACAAAMATVRNCFLEFVSFFPFRITSSGTRPKWASQS